MAFPPASTDTYHPTVTALLTRIRAQAGVLLRKEDADVFDAWEAANCPGVPSRWGIWLAGTDYCPVPDDEVVWLIAKGGTDVGLPGRAGAIDWPNVLRFRRLLSVKAPYHKGKRQYGMDEAPGVLDRLWCGDVPRPAFQLPGWVRGSIYSRYLAAAEASDAP